MAVVFLFYLPIDCFKYKCSRYYKDTKEKYRILDGFTPYFELYNIVKSAELPIEYTKCPAENTPSAYGFFLFKDTLILYGYSDFVFDKDINDWTIEVEDEWIKVEELIAEEISECRKHMGEESCKKAVILLDRRNLYSEDILRAEENEMFLLYDGDIATALKKFVLDNSDATDKS